MIYTSYFGRIDAMIDNDILPVAITTKKPDWYNGFCYKKLAPSTSSLLDFRVDHQWEKFAERYREERLRKCDAKTVLADIETLIGVSLEDTDIALMSYEYEDPNHRCLVREWLVANGIPCEEWESY